MKLMIVLAIDTATNECAACLYDAEKDVVLAGLSLDIGRGHAEHLLGTIDQVMAAADRRFEDIDQIAVSVGPGSFTGIRVGVATARALGLVLGKPVVGVSTLEAIAADADLETPFSVAILAGRGQAYVQSFDTSGAAHSQPFIVKLDENPGQQIEPSYADLFGNAAEQVDRAKALDFLDRATGTIKSIASLGARSDMGPVPLYVRAADAKTAEGFALPRQAEVAK